MFQRIRKSWENIWLPNGKTKVDIERDKEYEIKWVWYHTVLAVELAITNILLLYIAIML
jgi:hypothetical protein